MMRSNLHLDLDNKQRTYVGSRTQCSEYTVKVHNSNLEFVENLAIKIFLYSPKSTTKNNT